VLQRREPRAHREPSLRPLSPTVGTATPTPSTLGEHRHMPGPTFSPVLLSGGDTNEPSLPVAAPSCRHGSFLARHNLSCKAQPLLRWHRCRAVHTSVHEAMLCCLRSPHATPHGTARSGHAVVSVRSSLSRPPRPSCGSTPRVHKPPGARTSCAHFCACACCTFQHAQTQRQRSALLDCFGSEPGMQTVASLCSLPSCAVWRQVQVYPTLLAE